MTVNDDNRIWKSLDIRRRWKRNFGKFNISWAVRESKFDYVLPLYIRLFTSVAQIIPSCCSAVRYFVIIQFYSFVFFVTKSVFYFLYFCFQFWLFMVLFLFKCTVADHLYYVFCVKRSVISGAFSVGYS